MLEENKDVWWRPVGVKERRLLLLEDASLPLALFDGHGRVLAVATCNAMQRDGMPIWPAGVKEKWGECPLVR